MAEGCQRSGDAAASRANRGQKIEVLVGARKETILAKPQSKQEGRWRKGAGVYPSSVRVRTVTLPMWRQFELFGSNHA
jgi:hypothetical protein